MTVSADLAGLPIFERSGVRANLDVVVTPGPRASINNRQRPLVRAWYYVQKKRTAPSDSV
jgi:hypothetical protein